jgi:hypothetical protein
MYTQSVLYRAARLTTDDRARPTTIVLDCEVTTYDP